MRTQDRNIAVASTCPHCRHPLAGRLAAQCFVCGLDWHNPAQVVRRGRHAVWRDERSGRRRPGAVATFFPLLLLCGLTQGFLVLFAALLFQLPGVVLLGSLMAAPIVLFVNRSLQTIAGQRHGGERCLQRALLLVLSMGCWLFPAAVAPLAMAAFVVALGYGLLEQLRKTDRRFAAGPFWLLVLPAVVFGLACLREPQVAVTAVVLTFCVAEFLGLLVSLSGHLPGFRRPRRRRIASSAQTLA